MTDTAHPGSSLKVPARAMRFREEQDALEQWFSESPIVAAFFASMSSTFPAGERNFIKSVRHYQDNLKGEKLKEQVRGFIHQEAHHGVAHDRINQQFAEMGIPMARFEQRLQSVLDDRLSKLPPEKILAMTVSMEHITAIMAHWILSAPQVLEDFPKSIREMFLWHAVEEIEHKAVAFDVFMQQCGDRKILRAMCRISVTIFVLRMIRYTTITLWRLRILPRWRHLKKAWKFFYGKHGLMPSVRQPYRDFYREDFHPWDVDDRTLIDDWSDRLGLSQA